MKKLLITLLLISQSSLNASEKYRQFDYPERLFDSLIRTFPEFAERLGGNSAEINLRKIKCISRNVQKNDLAVTETKCRATNWNGENLEREGSSVFMALLNSGFKLDQSNEPGTSLIEIENISCAVIVPPPTNPDEILPEEYTCITDSTLH